MELILLEDVPNLGGIGDEVNVKPGYGRNFLLPRGFAILASKKNKRQLDHQKRLASFKRQRSLKDAQSIADKITGISLSIARKVGENDKLFGSVTAIDIERALSEQGLTVDRKRIRLNEPLKALGAFEVEVKVSSDVSAQLKVEVVADTADA